MSVVNDFAKAFNARDVNGLLACSPARQLHGQLLW